MFLHFQPPRQFRHDRFCETLTAMRGVRADVCDGEKASAVAGYTTHYVGVGIS